MAYWVYAISFTTEIWQWNPISFPCQVRVHRVAEKSHFYFIFVNFGKNWPVFIFFTIEFRKDLRKKLELKLTSCQATSVSWVFICLFAFFLPDTHVLVTLLRYIVCCVSHAFHYEDKRLAQHWTTHNRRIHWPVACSTQRMNMWRRQTFKHMW